MNTSSNLVVGERIYPKLKNVPGDFYFPGDKKLYAGEYYRRSARMFAGFLTTDKESVMNIVDQWFDETRQQAEKWRYNYNIQSSNFVNAICDMAKRIPAFESYMSDMTRKEHNELCFSVKRETLNLKGYGDIDTITTEFCFHPDSEDVVVSFNIAIVTSRAQYFTSPREFVLQDGAALSPESKDESFVIKTTWAEVADKVVAEFRKRQIMPHLMDMLNGITKKDLDKIKANLEKK